MPCTTGGGEKSEADQRGDEERRNGANIITSSSGLYVERRWMSSCESIYLCLFVTFIFHFCVKPRGKKTLIIVEELELETLGCLERPLQELKVKR